MYASISPHTCVHVLAHNIGAIGQIKFIHTPLQSSTVTFRVPPRFEIQRGLFFCPNSLYALVLYWVIHTQYRNIYRKYIGKQKLSWKNFSFQHFSLVMFSFFFPFFPSLLQLFGNPPSLIPASFTYNSLLSPVLRQFLLSTTLSSFHLSAYPDWT